MLKYKISIIEEGIGHSFFTQEIEEDTVRDLYPPNITKLDLWKALFEEHIKTLIDYFPMKNKLTYSAAIFKMTGDKISRMKQAGNIVEKPDFLTMPVLSLDVITLVENGTAELLAGK